MAEANKNPQLTTEEEVTTQKTAAELKKEAAAAKKAAAEKAKAEKEAAEKAETEANEVEDELGDEDVITEEQVNVATSKSTTNTVTVASNFPHPLKFKVPDRNGTMVDVIIKGNAENLRGKMAGVLPEGAYGITEVDADAWNWIKENYPDFPPIKNDLVFDSSKKQIKDAVKERTGLRNGFEAIDPNKTSATKPNKD